MTEREDITADIQKFAHCIRHLWMTAYSDITDNKSDNYDLLYEIEPILFDHIVLFGRDGLPSRRSNYRKPYDNIILESTAVDPDGKRAKLSGLVNRETGHANHCGYWDFLSVDDRIPMDSRVEFMELFDFDLYGYRKCQYALCWISSCPSNTDLANRRILVDLGSAYFYHLKA